MSTTTTHRGTYNTGCRCEDCRTYQRERVAKNRDERLAAERFRHGTRNAYDCGCRCLRCANARKRAYRRDKAARR